MVIQGQIYRAMKQSELEIDILVRICILVMHRGLLIHRERVRRPRWMPDAVDSTEP